MATLPPGVIVAAGATSASFTVTTKAVTRNRKVTISATYDAVTKQARLIVTRPSPSGGERAGVRVRRQFANYSG